MVPYRKKFHQKAGLSLPEPLTSTVGLFSDFSRDGNFMNEMLGGLLHSVLVHS